MGVIFLARSRGEAVWALFVPVRHSTTHPLLGGHDTFFSILT